MKRVYVNEDVCLGCHLCEYECAFSTVKDRDDTGKINNMFKAFNRDVSPKSKIRIEELNGDNPEEKINFAVSCRHCETPYCVMGCITGALSQGEDGVIRINHDKCIGCRTCIVMCPYGCLVINNDKTMLKCELCTEHNETPACVKACPNRAIVYEERE